VLILNRKNLTLLNIYIFISHTVMYNTQINKLKKRKGTKRQNSKLSPQSKYKLQSNKSDRELDTAFKIHAK